MYYLCTMLLNLGKEPNLMEKEEDLEKILSQLYLNIQVLIVIYDVLNKNFE
jgi:hypothetical protein